MMRKWMIVDLLQSRKVKARSIKAYIYLSLVMSRVSLKENIRVCETQLDLKKNVLKER